MDLHDAIIALHENVGSVEGNTQDDIVAKDLNGNEITIDWAAVNSWSDPNEYKVKRGFAYPSVKDQLDMLWHAIDTGTLDKTSDFYTTLKAVKDANPKPSE